MSNDAAQSPFTKKPVGVMPGSIDNARPSIVSSMSPSTPPALLARIGPKQEAIDDNRLQQSLFEHNRGPFDFRRASAPLPSMPTMIEDDIIYPEHSISQAQMRFGGAGGRAGGQTELADRIGAASFYGTDEEAEAAILAAAGTRTRGGKYPADFGFGRMGSNLPPSSRRAVSELSAFSSSSFASSSHSTATTVPISSIKDLLAASNAQPLANVLEVATRFVPFLQHKARKLGLHMAIVPGVGAQALENGARGSMEPPSVWIVLGHDQDAVRQLALSHSPPTAKAPSLFSGTASHSSKHLSPGPVAKDHLQEQSGSRLISNRNATICQLLAAGAVGGFAMFYALMYVY